MNSEAFKGLSLVGSVMSISCCAVELQMNIISSQIILGVPPYSFYSNMYMTSMAMIK